MNDNDKRQVWLYGEQCQGVGGDIVVGRYHDFGNEPDSADYDAWTVEEALIVMNIPEPVGRPSFQHKCARNVLKFFDVEFDRD